MICEYYRNSKTLQDKNAEIWKNENEEAWVSENKMSENTATGGCSRSQITEICESRNVEIMEITWYFNLWVPLEINLITIIEQGQCKEVRCRRTVAYTLPGICDLQMQSTALQFCAIIFKLKYTFCADEIQRYIAHRLVTPLYATIHYGWVIRRRSSMVRLQTVHIDM